MSVLPHPTRRSGRATVAQCVVHRAHHPGQEYRHHPVLQRDRLGRRPRVESPARRLSVAPPLTNQLAIGRPGVTREPCPTPTPTNSQVTGREPLELPFSHQNRTVLLTASHSEHFWGLQTSLTFWSITQCLLGAHQATIHHMKEDINTFHSTPIACILCCR